MNFLIDLESSALSEWLLVSMLGFPTLIALHSVGMAVTVGLSLMVALRLHEVLVGFKGERIRGLLNIAAWGFVLNFVTGLALFITRGSEYIVTGIFLIKMSLVVIGAILLFWVRLRLEPVQSGAEVWVADRVAKRMSLMATTAWFGAVVAGRLIAYLSGLY